MTAPLHPGFGCSAVPDWMDDARCRIRRTEAPRVFVRAAVEEFAKGVVT